MASKRVAITAAIKAALRQATVGGTDRPAGLTVYGMRERPVQPVHDLPTIRVMLEEEVPDRDASLKTDRTLRVVLACHVESGDSEPDVALDELFVWAVKALVSDHTLGDLVNNVVEGPIRWDYEEAADSFAAAEIEFEIMYQTAYNDPGA